MAKKYEEIRRRKLSKAQIEKNDAWAAAEANAIDLRELRELLGLSQAQVAEAVEMSQSEVSRLERRRDMHISMLERVVKKLGGELRIVAQFGARSIQLRAA